METQVLVLNTSYQPVARVPWQRAVKLWFLGRVAVVEEYEDKHIRSMTFEMQVPSVVRYLKGDFYKKRSVRFSRENVYARDRGRCAYCGRTVSRREATYDHVVPRAQGGKTRWENIVIACGARVGKDGERIRGCNEVKDNRTPEQANMWLRVKPHKPRIDPGLLRVSMTWDTGMPPSWRQFLVDTAYWHGELDSD